MARVARGHRPALTPLCLPHPPGAAPHLRGSPCRRWGKTDKCLSLGDQGHDFLPSPVPPKGLSWDGDLFLLFRSGSRVQRLIPAPQPRGPGTKALDSVPLSVPTSLPWLSIYFQPAGSHGTLVPFPGLIFSLNTRPTVLSTRGLQDPGSRPEAPESKAPLEKFRDRPGRWDRDMESESLTPGPCLLPSAGCSAGFGPLPRELPPLFSPPKCLPD